ncbi:MAG: hypothetical protein LJE96_00500 [Deltaproteobacteria bacterium]|nr:hypothetical protein [Deltaproteobacteria bacterium]
MNKAIFLYFLLLIPFIHQQLKPGKATGILTNGFFFLLAGSFVTAYIRLLVYDHGILATDEGNYAWIIHRINANPSLAWPISGPLYVKLINFLHQQCHLPILTAVPLMASLVSTLLPVFLYFGYVSILGGKTTDSALSCLILLSSSYFLWSMLEGRPQQLCLLFLFLAAVFYHEYLADNSFKAFIAFFIFYVIVFAYHILSFFVLSLLIAIMWYVGYLNGSASLYKLSSLIIPLIICALLFFHPHSFYASTLSGIKHYHLKHVNLPVFFSLAFGAFGLLLLFKQKIARAVHIGLKWGQSAIFMGMAFLLSIGVLVFQYILIEKTITDFYAGSLAKFIVFQSGNIFFGLMYFVGLHILAKSPQKSLRFFVITSLGLTWITLLFTFLSFFLGSKNWGIRLINFWVVFAAPVVAVAWVKAAGSAKIAVVLLLSFFMAVSLIHSSKDADLFRFEYIWEKDDIAAIEWLCRHEGKYCIKHTGHDFTSHYSKENSYKRLMAILCDRKPIICSGAESSLVKKQGKVEIYRY